jgi:DNA-binding CsgD family transcriptional regulator
MSYALKCDNHSVFLLLERIQNYVRRRHSASDQCLLESIVSELQEITPISSLMLAQFKNNASLDPIQFKFVANVNIAEEYIKQYTSNNLHQIDSILKYSISTRIPITWSAALNSKFKSEEFESFLNDCNFKYGLSYSLDNGFQSYASYLAFESKSYDCLEIQCVAISYLLPFFHDIASSGRFDNNIISDIEVDYFELTQREKEVLQWVMEGKTNWEISIILSISEGTVRYHITKILRKLKATNCSHAIAKAIKYNIISI